MAAYEQPVPELPALAATPDALDAWLRQHLTKDITLDPPQPAIRYHHVRHREDDLYLLVNEGPERVSCALQVAAKGTAQWWDAETGAPIADSRPDQLTLAPCEGRVLRVAGEAKA